MNREKKTAHKNTFKISSGFSRVNKVSRVLIFSTLQAYVIKLLKENLQDLLFNNTHSFKVAQKGMWELIGPNHSAIKTDEGFLKHY